MAGILLLSYDTRATMIYETVRRNAGEALNTSLSSETPHSAVMHVMSPAQLQHLWDALDIGHNTTDEVFVTRIYDMMPSNPAFSHYNGSLTTPPCTEVTPLSKD